MMETNTIPYQPEATAIGGGAKLKIIFIEVVSILLALLFGLTALDKALHFEHFHAELGKSPFLMAYQGWVAWGTPTVEAIVAVALLFRQTRLWGLYASVSLMSLFTGYVYLLLNYSYYTPCLCSAALESLSWEQHLAFNIVFLALAVLAAAWLGQRSPTKQNTQP